MVYPESTIEGVGLWLLVFLREKKDLIRVLVLTGIEGADNVSTVGSRGTGDVGGVLGGGGIDRVGSGSSGL